VLEFEIQNRFIEHIIGRRPIKSPEVNRLEIYRELIYSRFEEVITNALPIFSEKIGKDRIAELVTGFIGHKPESPYIWQAPYEFSNFVKSRNMLPDLPWADDLLWYEWTEIDLFMRCPPPPDEPETFDWNRPWQLSGSTRMRRLRYRVYLDDYDEPGDFPLILYYHYSPQEVHYQEITPFLYDVFNTQGETAAQSLRRVCGAHKIIPEELEELLTETMQNYVDKKILEAV